LPSALSQDFVDESHLHGVVLANDVGDLERLRASTKTQEFETEVLVIFDRA